jgi:hypothetical protein
MLRFPLGLTAAGNTPGSLADLFPERVLPAPRHIVRNELPLLKKALKEKRK